MFYEIFRLIGLISGYPLQLIFFKTKKYYETKKNKRWRKGGKLIISNHFSVVDYIVTAFLVFPRQLHGVCAEFAFKYKISRFGLKFFGAIEANRNTKNMDFIEKSVEVIRKKKLVQIFPEAHNTPDGKIHEFKPSYIVIAYHAECPIIPIVTDGNYGLFKRTHIIIGDEIDVSQFITSNKEIPTNEELELINNYVRNKVLELRETLENLKNKKQRKNK